MDPYGISLMRQFIEPLPNELIEAGRVGKASKFRIYAQIVLPQLKPAVAILALITFVFQFKDLLWPLIATKTTDMRTMPISLTLFSREFFSQRNLTAPGALVLFLPTAILFFFTHRSLVSGVAPSGLKG